MQLRDSSLIFNPVTLYKKNSKKFCFGGFVYLGVKINPSKVYKVSGWLWNLHKVKDHENTFFSNLR